MILKTVILKLACGDNVIGEELLSNASGVSIKRPIQVRMIPYQSESGEIIEKPIITMYCQFSDDEEFLFLKNQIVYCKEVIPKIAEFYVKIAKEFYSVAITRVVTDDDSIFIDETDTKDIINRIKKNLH